MEKNEQIIQTLKQHREKIAPVFQLRISDEHIVHLDFTSANQELKRVDISNTDAFTAYINTLLDHHNKIGVGGYGEDRFIYKRSSLFAGEKEPRSIHLGIDIWVPEGTKVYNPLPAKVHSFNYNADFGDYGGTIILQHELDSVVFFTLYGHLSKASLNDLYEGKRMDKGISIAQIGGPQENGQWPPHLHFQLISDMLDKKGDFFGVAPPSEKEYYLNLCLNPDYILKIQ